MIKKPEGQFYFPLFRAIAFVSGRDARRSEGNGTEALMACFAIYVVHYLFFADWIVSLGLNKPLTVVLLLSLSFGIWFFWLLLVYFNWLMIRLVRGSGLFRQIPVRHIQSILWVTCTTVMAFSLLRANEVLHEVAALWLVIVAMNLAAAAILASSKASRESKE